MDHSRTRLPIPWYGSQVSTSKATVRLAGTYLIDVGEHLNAGWLPNRRPPLDVPGYLVHTWTSYNAPNYPSPHCIHAAGNAFRNVSSSSGPISWRPIIVAASTTLGSRPKTLMRREHRGR